MNNMLLAYVAALLSASSAFAIKTPSDVEIAAIQKQIFTANTMDGNVRRAELRLLHATEIGSDEVDALKLELIHVKNRQIAARTIAIHMTIQAYDLPAHMSGTSVMPGTKGRTISWVPVGGEPEARQLQDAEGNFHGIGQPKELLDGKTYVDGTVYIYPGAFAHGVGYLASIVFHESVHFKQITTPGKGDVMSGAEDEVEAYQAVHDHALVFFDPNNADDRDLLDGIDRYLDENKAQAKQDEKERKTILGRLHRLLPSSNPSDMFDSRVHTDAELASLKQEANEFEDKARREMLKSAEAIQRARDAKDRQMDDALRVTLRDLAIRVCADPDSIDVAELQGLPPPRSPDAVQTIPNGLDSCTVGVYLYMATHLDQHQVPSLAAIKTLVHKNMMLRPVPQLPEETPWEASEREKRELIDDLNDSVQFTQQFLKSACRSDATLSDENVAQFRAALIRVNRDGAPVGYSRTTIAAGLGQCELDLLGQFYSHFQDFNYMRDVNAAVSKIRQQHDSRGRNRDDDSDHGTKKDCGQDGSDPSWCT